MDKIKWEKWGDYAIRSNGYSVSKSLIAGEWIYSAWKLPSTILGHYKNVKDAKAKVVETIGSESGKFVSTNSGVGQKGIELRDSYKRK